MTLAVLLALTTAGVIAASTLPRGARGPMSLIVLLLAVNVLVAGKSELDALDRRVLAFALVVLLLQLIPNAGHREQRPHRRDP